jgi:hypothetical protein
MNIMRSSYTILAATCLFLASCQKEYSVENGGNGGNNIGSNCRVSQIVQLDSNTRKGLASFNTYFNGSGQGTRVVDWDSVQNSALFTSDIVYSGDTMRVNANEFFLLASNKRVNSFHTFQNPADTASGALTFAYSYDASGYMSKKEIFVNGIAIPAVRFTYTWGGGNLLKVDGDVVVPGMVQKLFTASMEYDGTKTVKNFIPVFPDGYENFLYVMALDMGLKSRNPLTKMTASNYNAQGTIDQTVTTTFSKHVYSTDGYLLEWVASGDDPASTALPSGLTRFSYKCN